MSSFWDWHVKGVSSQRTALKIDVTGPGNTMLFAGASVHHSAPEFLQAVAVKGLSIMSTYFTVAADLTAHSLALQAAAAAAGINTPQFPFVFNPALLPLPPGLPVAEPVSIKTEAPSVQSRGCSPIIMSPSPAMEAADRAASLAAVGQKLVGGCLSF